MLQASHVTVTDQLILRSAPFPRLGGAITKHYGRSTLNPRAADNRNFQKEDWASSIVDLLAVPGSAAAAAERSPNELCHKTV